MGKQLAAFYDKANEKGGISARVKIAMITKMAVAKAEEAADSPENIKLFEQALAQI